MDKTEQINLDKEYTNDEYQELDMKVFFKEGGDPDFNPERNKYLFNLTVENQKRLYLQKKKMFNEGLRERMSAAESYIRYLEKGNVSNAEKYFGKKELARLRGQEVANSLKNITRINSPGYIKQFIERKNFKNRK